LPANVWLATGVLSAAIGREGWSIVRFMATKASSFSSLRPRARLRLLALSQAKAIPLVQRAPTQLWGACRPAKLCCAL
jgi:hypothetical protein